MGMRAKEILMLANMCFVTQNLHLQELSDWCQTPGSLAKIFFIKLSFVALYF